MNNYDEVMADIIKRVVKEALPRCATLGRLILEILLTKRSHSIQGLTEAFVFTDRSIQKCLWEDYAEEASLSSIRSSMKHIRDIGLIKSVPCSGMYEVIDEEAKGKKLTFKAHRTLQFTRELLTIFAQQTNKVTEAI
jgi:hypothetical protein